MTILVTGATGAIGTLLVERLMTQGVTLRCLSRHPPGGASVRRRMEWIAGDLLDPSAVARSVAGVDCVYHLAALLHINRPTKTQQRRYARINLDGTRLLTRLARRAGVQRMVYFSTIAVYGASRSVRPFDESSPVDPQTPYARSKLAAEEAVLSVRNRHGRPLGVVLRLAAVYGANMKGNYPRLLNALRRGVFIGVGEGRNRRTLVHQSDAVRAALLAGSRRAAAGRIYNLTDGQVHRFESVVAAICTALGKPAPKWSIPAAWARSIAQVVDRSAGRLMGREGALGAAIDKLTEDIAVDGRLIQSELGFRPEFDLQEGWRETIAAMTASKRQGRT
jgi:nucleoside-diphosphate-sugar epimerase